MTRALILVLLFFAPTRAWAQEPLHGRAGDWAIDVWVGGIDGSFGFQFTHGTEALMIDWEPSFQHGQQNLVAPLLDERARLGFDAWIRAELAAYLATPRSFRDRALHRFEQLRHGAEDAVRHGQLGVCDHPDDPNRYEYRQTESGEGAFDTCVHRQLNDAEKTELLAALRADIAHRERLVRENYRAWYATVRLLIPRAPST